MYVYIYRNICTHICIYIYTCVYVYMYIYVYAYIYTYTYTYMPFVSPPPMFLTFFCSPCCGSSWTARLACAKWCATCVPPVFRTSLPSWPSTDPGNPPHPPQTPSPPAPSKPFMPTHHAAEIPGFAFSGLENQIIFGFLVFFKYLILSVFIIFVSFEHGGFRVIFAFFG